MHMSGRAARALASHPRHLAAHSAYGSAANLPWLVKSFRSSLTIRCRQI
jgi:hypothetical protein